MTLATLVAMLAVVAGADGESSSPAPDPGRIVAGEAARSPAFVRHYWTPARMRAAIPADLSLSGPSGAPPSPPAARGRPSFAPPARASDVSAESSGDPGRLHGKVFFTLGTSNFVCSGTLVTSNSRSLVWTAGHCVHGADVGVGFATNWLFVPGYRDGEQPYGVWAARSLYAAQGWTDAANVRYDVGAALLVRDVEGRGIEDLLGARGIAFNQSRTQTFDILGYPAEDGNTVLLPPNFDGQHLWQCTSPRIANDTPPGSGPETMEIACDMTGGSSGGGWVIEDRFVNSVTSYGYEFDPAHLYGPYLGTVAEQVYATASGPELVCGGNPATNVGTGEANAYAGTAGADAFRLLGGDDRAVADAGDDSACGGGGADRLLGGVGVDDLRGGGGDDVLIGGPGSDQCIGGAGHDRAVGCDVRRGIP